MRCPAGVLLTNKEELVRDVTVRGEKVECRILREGNKAKNRTSEEKAWACLATCLEEEFFRIQPGREEGCRVMFGGQGSPLQAPKSPAPHAEGQEKVVGGRHGTPWQRRNSFERDC